jgi:hypothetical protein
MFPGDSRLRKRIKLSKMYGDEFGLKNMERSWKRQYKVRKQWMKKLR